MPFMPLPGLLDSEIAWVIRQVAEHIDRQRQTYRGRAVPLNAGQKAAMQLFFSASPLGSARVLVLTGECFSNPPFYGALAQTGVGARCLGSLVEAGP